MYSKIGYHLWIVSFWGENYFVADYGYRAAVHELLTGEQELSAEKTQFYYLADTADKQETVVAI